jgi:hypothetical protein
LLGRPRLTAIRDGRVVAEHAKYVAMPMTATARQWGRSR